MKLIEASIGDLNLLSGEKSAFLCSSKLSPSAILKCYDWAVKQRNEGKCVISGFHSRIEKDVFNYLISGKQPIIILLARGMYKAVCPEWKKAIDEGRLLIITPFKENVIRASSRKAEIRNRLMVDLANEIVVGYVSKGGKLEKLLSEVNDKKITKLYG